MQTPSTNSESQVIIGGGESVSAAIMNTPEMLDALSTGLYQNGNYAAVREVMCNAWDAHKMSGVKKAIEVVVEPHTLTIRDFGPGIPHDEMAKIYFTFGYSTKSQNNTVTGRYGLGSKAPFAMSDHFTVVNKCEGKAVTYAMRRRGEDGRPGLSVMSTVDTTETGLEVIIPIDNKDQQKIKSLAKHFAVTSALKTKIDGSVVTGQIEYPKDKSYVIIKDYIFKDQQHAPIRVKYGSIVYPLSAEGTKLHNLAAKTSYLTSPLGVLILIAAPGSLDIPPHRDTLSYSDNTIKECTRLLEEAYSELTAGIAEKVNQAIKESVAKSEIRIDMFDWWCLRGAIHSQEIPLYPIIHGHLGDVYSADRLRRTIRKEIFLRFRNERRLVRRLAALNGVSHAKRQAGEILIAKHKCRGFIRTAASVDLLSRLSCAQRVSGRLSKLTDMQVVADNELPFENMIVVARTTAEASPIAKAHLGAESGAKLLPVILLNSISKDDVKTMTEFGARHGITVAVDPKIIKEGTTSKVAFVSFSDGRSVGNRTVFKAPTITQTPNCYLEISGHRRSNTLTARLYETLQHRMPKISDIAVAFNRNEVNTLRKMKVPSLVSVLEARTVEAFKDHSTLLNYIRREILIDEASHHMRSPMKLIVDLIARDPNLLVPLKLLPGDRAYKTQFDLPEVETLNNLSLIHI